MTIDRDLFNAGPSGETILEVDVARQAVSALRGYSYQVLAATLAWIDIDANTQLYLEFAEDYAVVAGQALQAVQVKESRESGSITLNSPSVLKAIATFVDLVNRNPDVDVHLRFLTTSNIGQEKNIADRPEGMAGLAYWNEVAMGADPNPLRRIIQSDKFPDSVRAFSESRGDAALREDFIQKIRWDCGRPNSAALRKQLEAHLVVLGRDTFQIPAPIALRLVDQLLCRVLEKSTAKSPAERVLTRAQLYQEIESANTIPLSYAAVEALAAAAASSLPGALPGSGVKRYSLSATETPWIFDSAALPFPRGIIARTDLERAIASTLDNTNAVVLVGSSGLGKSIVSRAVAAKRADEFFVADFRDCDANETHQRLQVLFLKFADLSSSALILEDLNCLHDPRIAMALARVIDASRRNGVTVLVTCHRDPTLQALGLANLHRRCVHDCPYFSQNEVSALVADHGGDVDTWGQLAYIAGANGHPQLTHAFVVGMATQGWPIGQIETIVTRGLSSSDTDAARDAAKRSLVSALPEGTRTLLYRLSLISGRFNRSLALTIGEISPSIPRSGESMDQLIGPWIEPVGQDLFRTSPLASKFGSEMLSAAEQKRIHKKIAEQILERRVIDATEFNTVLLHAFGGESTDTLSRLAHTVLVANPDTLTVLAENVPMIRFLRTDRLIYPKHPMTSRMLRLAQFRVAAVTGKRQDVSEIVAALFSEIGEMPDGEHKRVFEEMVLINVLRTIGAANYLENWIDQLLRLKSMVEVSPYLQDLVGDLESSADASDLTYLGILFNIGSAQVESVSVLEQIINDLDTLDTDERTHWLTPLKRTFSDYSSFINTPWAAAQNRDDFDAADSAQRYRRMAEKTKNWNIRPLTLQCWIAQAVMLDEYLDDKQGALSILEEAVTAMGDDLILSRAIAKLHWRHAEYKTALEIQRSIADQVGRNNPVERTYALREAAISAAKCGDWLQAEQWFIDAQNAARMMQSHDKVVFEVGLRADSAVAALRTGNADRALSRLAESVSALANIDSDRTLRSAYCHRVIRHTVSWALIRTKTGSDFIAGKEFTMEPGTCSNPEPPPAVRDHPLSHIDSSWYMLAEAEAAAGVDVGITTNLYGCLIDGPIPALEITLRLQVIRTDVELLDACGFTAHFTRFLETAAFFSAHGNRMKETLDPLSPERGEIPALRLESPYSASVEEAATYAILAFAIRSAITGRPDAFTALETALRDRFAGTYPGHSIFDHILGKSTGLTGIDKAALTAIAPLLQHKRLLPEPFFVAGFRLLEWSHHRSSFRPALFPRLAVWQRVGWQRILSSQRFRLSRPTATVPAIERVLQTPSDDDSFVANLLLVASMSVGVQLSTEYRELLNTIAER